MTIPVLSDTASCFFSVIPFPPKLYIYILKGIAFQIAIIAGFFSYHSGGKKWFKLGKDVKNLWESYRRNIIDWHGSCNPTSCPTLVITKACHLHSRREYLGQAEATVCMQGLKGKKKNLRPQKAQYKQSRHFVSLILFTCTSWHYTINNRQYRSVKNKYCLKTLKNTYCFKLRWYFPIVFKVNSVLTIAEAASQSLVPLISWGYLSRCWVRLHLWLCCWVH